MRLIFSYVLVRCESYGGGPRSFQHPGLVSWKTIFHEPGFGVGEWFQASSVLNLLCTLLIFLLSQLHFRSSGIGSWGLGTPALQGKYCMEQKKISNLHRLSNLGRGLSTGSLLSPPLNPTLCSEPRGHNRTSSALSSAWIILIKNTKK